MLKLLLGDPNTRKLKSYKPIVTDINLLDKWLIPSEDQCWCSELLVQLSDLVYHFLRLRIIHPMVPLLVVRLPIYLKLRNLMPIWTLIPTIALTLCKETAVVRQVSPVVVHLFLDLLLSFLCLIW